MLQMNQMQIDMARNATDDFNLFHDRFRWDWIHNNPFKGPIALGFQLGLVIETQLKQLSPENSLLPYSFFQLNFAMPVKVNDHITFDAKSSRDTNKDNQRVISQRFILKSESRPSVIGTFKQAEHSLIQTPHDNVTPQMLRSYKDRSFVFDDSFLKRKWMIVGNAKNFLLSAFADQTQYIDEFADKVTFPAMYPLSLISSALLERAQALNYDLIDNPLVYTSHELNIDNKQLNALRSNDCLQMLVDEVDTNKQAGKTLRCTGWVSQSAPLFVGKLALSPLSSLLKS